MHADSDMKPKNIKDRKKKRILFKIFWAKWLF